MQHVSMLRVRRSSVLLVCARATQICEYYIAQSKAVHHGAREAACACMAELAEKVCATHPK
jgi:hypothetical protein